MSKSAKHDGHIIGLYSDLQGIHGQQLKHSNGHWWKWK
jgi:hypothetical protein